MKEPDWINQNYKNKMHIIQVIIEYLKMLISKRRLIHAISYEGILLVIIAIALSFIFDMPMEVTGTLGVFMAVVSVFWNMIFNHYFEKVEHKFNWERTISVRILHAFILDIGLTLCILVYTFIFQWCYDHIEDKFFPNAKAASLH